MKSLRSNRLRTSLTIVVIVIGISSIVGIQTSLAIISDKVGESFGKMGISTFSISSEPDKRPVSFRDAAQFKMRFSDKGKISIFNLCGTTASINYGAVSTDPVVTVMAADEHYLDYQMGEIINGRMIAAEDVGDSRNVAVIGENVRKRLFGQETGIGRTITVMGRKMSVIGIIEKQGSMLGMGLDNMVIIPVSTARNSNLTSDSYSIAVIANDDGGNIDMSILQAEMALKQIRDTDITNFSISKSDSLRSKLSSLKEKLSIATLVIGIIAMLGAAISLMNIMLVSVKERRLEIGVKKALGASKRRIELEFLTEAGLVGAIGAMHGIVVGLLFGYGVSLIMESEMKVPLEWMALAILISVIVSVMSAWVPARIASGTDPIESLRC